MARKVINYNSLVLKAMHKPFTKQGFVLYTKLSGATINEGNTKAEQDQTYIRLSKSTYNSPTNIRRLFITGSKVVVHLYSPFIHSGSAYKTHVIETAYDNKLLGVDGAAGINNMFDVVKAIMNEQNEKAKYEVEKMGGANVKEPQTYRIDGNILKVLSSTYTCNNIEEVYFDYTVLLAEELKPYVQQFSFEANWQRYTSNGSYSISKCDALAEAFRIFNSVNERNFRTKFPRLRQIGLISNLDEILKHPSLKDACSFARPTFKSWYETNNELIQASGSTVLITQFPVVKFNKEFNVKDNQYKFDKEVLKGAVEKYRKAIDNVVAGKSIDGDVTDNKEEDTKVELAKDPTAMDDMISRLVKVNDNYAKSVLTIAAEGLGKSARQELVDLAVDKKNKTLLSKSLGIK